MNDCENEKRIKAHKQWVQAALHDIGCVLSLRQDCNYYMQLAARLEKRLERLERIVLKEDKKCQ